MKMAPFKRNFRLQFQSDCFSIPLTDINLGKKSSLNNNNPDTINLKIILRVNISKEVQFLMVYLF